MKYELWHHKIAYFILGFGLVLATILFLAAWPNHMLQRVIVAGVSVFYVLWGVCVHLATGKISRRIIWEYVTVSILGGSMLYLITL